MKKFLPLLFVLFSCSRDVQRLSDGSEISFDINGSHQEYKGGQTYENGGIGTLATKIQIGQSIMYSFSGTKDNANIFQTIIQTTIPDTLKTINYHLISGLALKVNNSTYGIIGASDYLNISINNYREGKINATFSGIVSKVINTSTTEPATITNGIMKDISIKY